MGKQLIIKGADFSENGFRTSNFIDVALSSGGTNPYNIYLLPTPLTYDSGTNSFPAVPNDAVPKAFTADGSVDIDNNNIVSFLCGRNTTDNSPINIKSLEVYFNKYAVANMNQSCIGINADVVDLRGVKFASNVNTKKMFLSSSIAELKMPDLEIDGAENMFWNYCNSKTDVNASFTFIKKLKGICKQMFCYLKCATADFSGMDVTGVTDFDNAFKNSTLREINIADWAVQTTARVNSMFEGCTNLVTLHLDNWNCNPSSSSLSNAMFVNTPSLTTVFVTNCSSTIKTWLIGKLNSSTAGGSSNWVESTVSGKAALVKGS